MSPIPSRLLVVVSLLLAPLAVPIAIAQSGGYQIEGNQLTTPGPVVFETGSDKIKSDSEPVLQHVKSYLNDKSYISTMRIEVHSDNQGSSAFNQKQSEARALAVGRWLISQGIDCKRLIAVGFGETKPIANNATPDGRAQNRRVAFVNAALRGRPIGGMPIDGGGKVAGDLCSSSGGSGGNSGGNSGGGSSGNSSGRR